MFDFLRNLTKSAEEKRQETVAAYLDEALNGRERQRFEQEMAQDMALRVHVEQLLLIKQSLRQLPQRSVPHNFMLDPAAYGRPAPQPWVQAYPILRTATALAAFFFIFAIAANLFTTFNAADSIASAPVADVAQLEEAADEAEVATFATEAESAAGDAITSDAAADVAEEESALNAAVEVLEETAEVLVEEMAEEAIEEAAEPAAEEEAPPTAEATAAAPTTSTLQSDSPEAEDGAVPAPQETREALATPTVSTLPRVTPPTPLPDRDPELAQETDDTANDIVAEVPAGEGERESVETTAVLPEEAVRDIRSVQPVNPLLWLQIGLGLLLLLLVGLTFYARRQR